MLSLSFFFFFNTDWIFVFNSRSLVKVVPRNLKLSTISTVSSLMICLVVDDKWLNGSFLPAKIDH